jgi:hypothetical protein
VEPAGLQITLASIPLGGRLLIRSKKDWRVAVVSRIGEDKITISVASPVVIATGCGGRSMPR